MNNDIKEAIKEEKRAYFRSWRAKNKDKIKKINSDYWKRRTEKRLKEEV